MRLDYVSKFAHADGTRQFFEVGVIDAEAFGQSASWVSHSLPSFMVLVASK